MKHPLLRNATLTALLFGAMTSPDLRAQQDDVLPAVSEAIAQGGVPTSLQEWRGLEQRLVALCARVRPAVVTIGGGSGVIVADNLVLTAAHVIGEPGKELTLILDDGRRVKGVALGLNSASDTGLVRITGDGDYPHCEMGSFDGVGVGDWCMLLGHPGGRRPAGPPLRFGRVLRADADRWLVTDCTIEGGDSGGPLFDLDGRVIGIHSRITADLSHNMHVPIAAFAREWTSLLASEKASQRLASGAPSPSAGGAWLRGFGASLALDTEGASVATVDEGSAAAVAGLAVGDRLLRVDGRAVSASRVPLPRRRLSGSVTLRVRRGAEERDIVLSIAHEKPADADDADPAMSPGSPLRHDVDGFARGSRNAYELVESLEDVVRDVRLSVVRVTVDERDVALGAIVRGDGLVVTKSSEIGGGRIHCVLADGSRHLARRVASDAINDVALLKIDAEGLRAIEWSEEAPEAGRIVVTPSEETVPAAYGAISLRAYRPRGRGRAGAALGELGALFAAGRDTPSVVFVRKGSAAAAAGLEPGDVIREIDDVAVGSLEQVVRALRDRHEGETVEIHLLRGDKEVVVDVRLSLRRGSAPAPENAQEPLWGLLSSVRSGFTDVLAHDTVLLPDRCGGPLVTLDGKVVGLNVARTGRVESTALPAAIARDVVADLMARYEGK